MERPLREGRLGRGRLDRVRSHRPDASTVATHRALYADVNERRCDRCDALIPDGAETGGSGLYLWTRGEELRFEEPPLCETCGPEIANLSFRRWEEEEEEEG